MSSCPSPKSNLPLTPNRLSYRNVSHLFGMLRLSPFEWCQLLLGQPPKKTLKNAEKRHFWDFFRSLPFINRLLMPNCLSYRNMSDLFGMLRLSPFEWCPLCWGQTPQKRPKMPKTTEKRHFWDIFRYLPFTNWPLTPNCLSYRNVSDLFEMLKNAENHQKTTFSICHLLLIMILWPNHIFCDPFFWETFSLQEN